MAIFTQRIPKLPVSKEEAARRADRRDFFALIFVCIAIVTSYVFFHSYFIRILELWPEYFYFINTPK